jgi:hypothetical protein
VNNGGSNLMTKYKDDFMSLGNLSKYVDTGNLTQVQLANGSVEFMERVNGKAKHLLPGEWQEGNQ